MPAPAQITASHLLVVEGATAKSFFDALCAAIPVRDMQVMNFGGVNELPGFLKALVAAPGFAEIAAIGVIRDCEVGPAPAAFDSVCTALGHANLPVPTAIETLAAGPPALGVMLLPDAHSQGMLETLCLRSIVGQPVEVCVDNYIACVLHAGRNPHPIDKAKAHAYLASCERPELRVGEAAARGYWPLDHPAFDGARAFISRLALLAPAA